MISNATDSSASVAVTARPVVIVALEMHMYYKKAEPPVPVYRTVRFQSFWCPNGTVGQWCRSVDCISP